MYYTISDKNDRILQEDIRKLSKSNNDLPNGMDGYSKVEEITDTFSDKYKTLYDSVNHSEHDLNKLTTEIESHIDNSYPNIKDISNKTPSISLQEVKNAMLELKQGKKEENGLYSNHFINGMDRLFVLITLLFNCMLIHGIAPDELLLDTMIPLIKK